MSTLVVESYNNALWLVHYASPSAERCTVIAHFASAEAAEIYKAEVARAMLFSREVGRSGLG